MPRSPASISLSSTRLLYFSNAALISASLNLTLPALRCATQSGVVPSRLDEMTPDSAIDVHQASFAPQVSSGLNPAALIFLATVTNSSQAVGALTPTLSKMALLYNTNGMTCALVGA